MGTTPTVGRYIHDCWQRPGERACSTPSLPVIFDPRMDARMCFTASCPQPVALPVLASLSYRNYCQPVRQGSTPCHAVAASQATALGGLSLHPRPQHYKATSGGAVPGPSPGAVLTALAASVWVPMWRAFNVSVQFGAWFRQDGVTRVNLCRSSSRPDQCDRGVTVNLIVLHRRGHRQAHVACCARCSCVALSALPSHSATSGMATPTSTQTTATASRVRATIRCGGLALY